MKINTETEYLNTMDRIEELMAQNPNPESTLGQELNQLIDAVITYEEAYCPL